MDLKKFLFHNLYCPVNENVSLAQYCTFGAGGTAEYLVAPSNVSDIVLLMQARKQYQFPLYYLGGGSNVLFSDVEGIVVHSTGFRSLNYIECERNKIIIEVGSGYPLVSIVKESLTMGFSGFEFAVGIPGTVGGAVIGNAGTSIKSIGELLLWVECVTPDGSVEKLDSKDIKSSYRYSSLSDKGCFITKCAFEVQREDISKLGLLREKSLEYLSMRSNQPLSRKSAGCIFKNPVNDFAGKLLDESGCKGMRVGGAVVSEMHANFCINSYNASVLDIKELVYKCRDTVYKKKGILLDFEVKMFGF